MPRIFSVYLAGVLCFIFLISQRTETQEANPRGMSVRILPYEEIIKRATEKPILERVVSDPSIFANRYKFSITLNTQYHPDPLKSKNESILTAEELKILSTVLGQMPKPFVALLDKHLLAFHFESGNQESNRFYSPLPTSISQNYIVMSLSRDLFTQSACDFLNVREQALFSNDEFLSEYGVEILTDKNIKAIWFVLMQKTAEFYRRTHSIGEYTDDVWENFYQPIPQFTFEFRDSIKTQIRNVQLSIQKAEKAYRHLAMTPFVSLSGSQSIADDFVESVTLYYLTHKLGSQYQITTFKSGQKSFIYSPFENGKVIGRLRQLNDILSIGKDG